MYIYIYKWVYIIHGDKCPIREGVHTIPHGTGPSIAAGDIASAPHTDSTRLSQWITCVCVFVFDLERGQTLEALYPPLAISTATINSLKFLAFPDSNTGIDWTGSVLVREQMYACGSTALFRPAPLSRRSYHSPSHLSLSLSLSLCLCLSLSLSHSLSPPLGSDGDHEFNIRVAGSKGRFYFGSVLFRQLKDTRSKRGYMQKVMV